MRLPVSDAVFSITANSEIYASLNVKSNIRNETHKENMQRKGQRIRKWLW